MATTKWSAFTDRGALLTTALNSLADATLSSASTALDNGTNLDTHCIIEITLASLNPTGSPYLELYMTQAPDGTNYNDAPVIGGTDTNTILATIPVSTGTGAKKVSTGLIVLPPCKVQFYLGNQLNVALGASGNTLDVYTTNLVTA